MEHNPYASPQTPVETAKPFPKRGVMLMLNGIAIGILSNNMIHFATADRWNASLFQLAIALAVLSLNLPLLRRGD